MLFVTKVRTGLLALAAALVLTAPARAQFIDFEDRPAGDVPIENGYKGFDWQGFGSYSEPVLPGDGYDLSMHGERAAYNEYEQPGWISRSTSFDFFSAYIGAAWNDGLTVTVRGLLNGVELFTQSVNVNTRGSQLVVFNFTGINALHFTSAGGTNSGVGGSGAHFIID